MSENKKRQRAFKYKMDDFCSTQLCAGKETCMLDPQRISVSEHNGPFLDLKRAATLIMQLSLSLLTVNNSTKRWPWQIWGEKGGVIIVPESENKDTEWWLNSSPSLFHTSYTSHTSVRYLQKKKKNHPAVKVSDENESIASVVQYEVRGSNSIFYLTDSPKAVKVEWMYESSQLRHGSLALTWICRHARVQSRTDTVTSQ